MRTNGFSDLNSLELEPFGDFLRVFEGDVPCPKFKGKWPAMRFLGRILKLCAILNSIMNFSPSMSQFLFSGSTFRNGR